MNSIPSLGNFSSATVATEMVEQTDSGRLFQRDGAQERQALAPALVLTLATDKLLSLFDLSEWDKSNGTHGVEINRLFFMQGFVGQQIDLEQYSKPYRQPMKGMKQWNIRRLCHQAGQLSLNTLKPCEVNITNTIQK